MTGPIPSQNPKSAVPPVEVETTELPPRATVACVICGAAYAPSPFHQELVQAPASVLDAALMSMSHFCFRCRRASCPECWDHVHAICGACVAEVGLPFRTALPPLADALYPPPPTFVPPTPAQSSAHETDAPLLTCIRAGRFHASERPSTFIAAIQTVETTTVAPLKPPALATITPSKLPAPATYASPKPPAPATFVPPKPLTPASPPPRPRVSSSQPLAVPPTVPFPPAPEVDIADIPTIPPKPVERLPMRIADLPTAPPLTEDEEDDEEPSPPMYQVQIHLPPTKHMRPAPVRQVNEIGRLERTLTIITLLILLLIVTMLILAEASPDANTLIAQYLHIDIRAEIEYLLHLVQLLH
ncbi:MAG: hypothetical protein M3Y81_25575 [Chloroflexota bacterium]|nr:hypothetical protein [Chloroflexota bacterium]